METAEIKREKKTPNQKSSKKPMFGNSHRINQTTYFFHLFRNSCSGIKLREENTKKKCLQHAMSTYNKIILMWIFCDLTWMNRLFSHLNFFFFFFVNLSCLWCVFKSYIRSPEPNFEKNNFASFDRSCSWDQVKMSWTYIWLKCIVQK